MPDAPKPTTTRFSCPSCAEDVTAQVLRKSGDSLPAGYSVVGICTNGHYADYCRFITPELLAALEEIA